MTLDVLSKGGFCQKKEDILFFCFRICYNLIVNFKFNLQKTAKIMKGFISYFFFGLKSNNNLLAVFFAISLPFFVFAATSANYQTDQERAGSVEFSATSTNYQFDAEIGHPGVGQSTSGNYIYDHGTIWATSTITTTIQWAVPESRAGVAGTNDDVGFYLTIRTADSDDDVVLFTSGLASTSDDGTYATPISFTGLNAGTYDIGFKGSAHLTKVLNNIYLVAGDNVLNFTQADNSATKGSVTLVAGDVSGDGGSVSELGDDVVNSVDLSLVLSQLDVDDSTGNGLRPNLNQDTVVNSVDLSLMISNLDQEGDN